MTYDYEYFKKAIYDLTKIDLNAYKEKQMKRRIDTLIAKNKIVGYEKYVAALKSDKNLFEEFVNYLTINVSEFYRNVDQWRLLDQEIIPDLIKRYGNRLKIWSAACSTGDEPYSLVMALSRHLPLANIRILATDLDRQVIEQAKEGIYCERSIVSVPPDLKRRFFRQTGSSFKIANEIKNCVEFREHNLLKDAYPTGCHLIVCRNVMIYFTEEVKEQIFRKYYNSLANGGLLFIGASEQMMNHKEIGFFRKNAFFYQKAL